ncbi:uncharacterized protein MELLADRAFT_96289 [Melampsora larici-populina 98AG31]|uniref:Uncharacterized protein n=1 Tax=Melampsora larici-populina (strain 98AG31 / pathotype 3-4-7) TaxID=747676 RepID=F4RE86_MELLP|nr:uncharacterized protein MELLADRAFT_96289 [Melampsora larici-populina 98AG31]EGG09317.1 hypothetical protein MELLADRAFT_96289 [Melampsora larici-populina 98AG31]
MLNELARCPNYQLSLFNNLTRITKMPRNNPKTAFQRTRPLRKNSVQQDSRDKSNDQGSIAGEDDDRVVGMKHRRVSPKRQSGKSKKSSLEGVGVFVGPKTSRERLQELLQQHITRKKVKCDGETGPARRSQTLSARQFKIGKSGGEEVKSVAKVQDQTSNNIDVDYNIYNHSQLNEMLRGVGLDMSAADKEELVKLCREYHDLIILPSPEPPSEQPRSRQSTVPPIPDQIPVLPVPTLAEFTYEDQNHPPQSLSQSTSSLSLRHFRWPENPPKSIKLPPITEASAVKSKPQLTVPAVSNPEGKLSTRKKFTRISVRRIDPKSSKSGNAGSLAPVPSPSCQLAEATSVAATFENRESVEMSSPQASPTPTSIPRLEHGRLLYPRPNPTNLSSALASTSAPSRCTKATKGKGKAKADSDQWEPSEDENESDHSGNEDSEEHMFSPLLETFDQQEPPPLSTPNHDPSGISTGVSPHSGTFNRQKPCHSSIPHHDSPAISVSKTDLGSTPSLSNMIREIYTNQISTSLEISKNSAAIEEMLKLLKKTITRIEGLNTEVRALSHVVTKVSGSSSPESLNIRGGRIAAHMRFHVETLFGQREDDSTFPAPASDEEKANWMKSRDLESIEADVTAPTFTMETLDSHFPYPDGPGHKDSTPTQLSVMRQMMNSVGVRSFRPDFSISQRTGDNKWLWDLALKIFVKLTECGEYPGVPSNPEGQEQMKKSLTTYVQGLSKRYRQESWDLQRKNKAVEEGRRNARRGHWSMLHVVMMRQKMRKYYRAAALQKLIQHHVTFAQFPGAVWNYKTSSLV